MSKYAEGTIVQHNEVDTVKYRLNSREVGDDRPWEAIDVPPILVMLMGDENNELRFHDTDISESIEAGDLIVIYTP